MSITEIAKKAAQDGWSIDRFLAKANASTLAMRKFALQESDLVLYCKAKNYLEVLGAIADFVEAKANQEESERHSKRC